MIGWAVLKFTPERGRWVKDEAWHPMPESHEETDGSDVLSVPHTDDGEIGGDIMRFAADVQVIESTELRSKVQKAFLSAVNRYL